MNLDFICSLRNSLVPVLLIMALGLGLRILYCNNNPLLDRDSITYCEVAEKWHQTNRLDIPMHHTIGNTDAGYIYLLKKGIDLHIPVVLWGRIIGVLATLVYFVAVYEIGLIIFKDHRALLLLFLACIQPATGQMAFNLLRDPVCYSLYAIAILSMLHLFQNRSYIWTAAFSASAILAFFMRYEALELFAIFFILSFFCIKQHKDKRFLFLSLLECAVVSSLLFGSILVLTDIPLEKSFADISSKIPSILPK